LKSNVPIVALRERAGLLNPDFFLMMSGG